MRAGSVSNERRPTPVAQRHLAHQTLTWGFDYGDVEHGVANCTDRPERLPHRSTLKVFALEGPEVPTAFTARTVNA